MLDYQFLITKTSSGVPIGIWQDYDGQDFGKLVRVVGSLEEKATVTVVTMEQRKAWPPVRRPTSHSSRRRSATAPGAVEFWLVWGLDGWCAIPEAARPLEPC